MKYELKTQTPAVEAHRWFQNGDHPADNYMAPSSEEGAVVCRFDGVQTGGGFHDSCGNYWVQHGQLEEEEDGSVMICPGDWILNTPGEEDYHALTARDFDEKYQPAASTAYSATREWPQLLDDTTEIAIDLLKNEVACCDECGVTRAPEEDSMSSVMLFGLATCWGWNVGPYEKAICPECYMARNDSPTSVKVLTAQLVERDAEFTKLREQNCVLLEERDELARTIEDWNQPKQATDSEAENVSFRTTTDVDQEISLRLHRRLGGMR